MTEYVHHTEEDAHRWMRDIVQTLFEANGNELLRDLLNGIGLPPVGHAEESYVWIVRGMPSGAALPRAEARIAYLLSRVLPTLGNDATRMYNALRLAACLAAPDYLCEPLSNLYEARTVDGMEYRGIPLREALRGAIIENQIDDRYRKVWRAMYEYDGDERLGGTPTSGFDGVLWMPPHRDERGRPDFAEIGRALGAIASDLELTEPQSTWLPEFHVFLGRARAAYPREEWSVELLRAADANDWPRWAVYALPQGCGVVVGENAREGTKQVAFLDFFSPVVHDEPVRERWCGGTVIVCDLPTARIDNITNMLQPIEAARIQLDLVGEPALFGALMPEIALAIPYATHDAQSALARMHQFFTARLNVGAERASVLRR